MKYILPLLVLLTAACGFHPVYGVNKYTAVGVEEKLAATDIGGIPDREGQYLRNALIDRFYRDGRPINPRYKLEIGNIAERTRNLDITVESDATREQLRLRTTFKLTDLQTNEMILDRTVQSLTSYNVIESEFANRVSEQQTRENALDDLANQIEMQLALYFKRTQ